MFVAIVILEFIVNCRGFDTNGKSRDHDMTNRYVEAILIWSDKGASKTVNDWLVEKGLKIMPMREGLLISGEELVFKHVFQVESVQSERTVALPVPAELSDHVSTIFISKHRQF